MKTGNLKKHQGRCIMEKREFTEETTLKDILGSFMDSYAERDGKVEFSGWLENKLRLEIPNLSEEAGRKLAGEIIEAVAAYDRTLSELNMAVEAGQSKETWLAERLAENYADMSVSDAGEKLFQIEENVVSSNQQLMQEISGEQTEAELIEANDEATVEWNEYSIKKKAYEIGNQFAMTGMAVAANVVKDRLQSEDATDIGSVIKETLQGGLIKDSSEVKAVVAGAVKVAAEKGLENIVPEDVTVDVIGNVAGAAVEGAEALCDVATGKSTMREALEKIGKAAVAAGGRLASEVIKGKLEKVPYVGEILVDLAGGLLDHLHSPKFVNNAYNMICDAAVDTWEGVKQSQVGRVFAGLKKKVFG